MVDEEPLHGGNASGDDVVRVDATVRKPWTASTPSVVHYVDALRAAGVDVPEPRGRDDRGRQIIEFVPGTLALGRGRLTRAELRRVGTLVRSIHDASLTYVPPADAIWQTAIPAPGQELLCHNDLAPWNLVVGDRWVFIDWDAAAPSTRLWDLAYAAQAFTLSNVDLAPAEAAGDLAALVDGYGADPSLREHLADALVRRAEAMYDLLRSSHETGAEPWASMYVQGHGEHWRTVSAYAAAHRDVWAAALT